MLKSVQSGKHHSEAAQLLAGELQALSAIGEHLQSVPAPSELLDEALGHVSAAIEPDLAVVYFRRGDQLKLAGMRPENTSFRANGGEATAIGQCLCGMAAAKAGPVFSEDIHTDPRCTLRECKLAEMRCFAAVPLIRRDEVLGVLGVAWRKSRRLELMAPFLETMAAQLSVGIQLSQATQQLQADAARLQQEMAGRIQAEQALLAAHEQLEHKVKDRTAQLAAANSELEAEVAHRRQVEQLLHRAQQATMSARDEERQILARDLHDSLGQQIVALNLALKSVAVQAAEVKDAGVATRLTELQHQTLEMTAHLRHICHGLFPPTLEILGLASALDRLAGDMGQMVAVKTNIASCFGSHRLGVQAEIMLYRVAQEALSNAVRHSRCQNVRLELLRQDGHALLTVTDDGIGFDVAGAGQTGLGLQSMRERAMAIGGELTIESRPGKTTIQARLPLAEK